MKKRNYTTFEQYLQDSLRDPKFKKAWQQSEPEYQIARQMIKNRLKHKLNQNKLAQRAKTTQAVISRLETMSANPSIGLLQKISTALNTPFNITIRP